jgi:hypothetical protein
VVYILACLLLAVMTSHRGRSLVGGSAMPISEAPAGAPFSEGPMDY